MKRERPFTARDVAAAWDRGADAWDEFIESGADYYRTEVHGPGLLKACGNVRGLRVLDMGCGQGYFSRQLAEKGAVVTGIDLSERQIANARRHEQARPLGIEYRVMAAEEIADVWRRGDFDMATACMAIHDMPHPAAALRGTARVLKPGSRLVYSAPNPSTDTPSRAWDIDRHGRKGALRIDRYFETGPTTMKWNMRRLTYKWETPTWRRTLSDITAMIADAGFLLRRIHEPRPTAEQVARIPDLEDSYRLPYFLVFDCVRQA